jgi:hypothetical protein
MQGTQVVVELLPSMQIAVICWPWDVTGGRYIDFGVAVSVLQALADIQLHCLTGLTAQRASCSLEPLAALSCCPALQAPVITEAGPAAHPVTCQTRNLCHCANAGAF